MQDELTALAERVERLETQVAELLAKAPRKKAGSPVVDDEFREKMHTRFGPFFGDTVDERIDEALGHDAAKKCADPELYVTGWLRRDAEKMPANRGATRQEVRTNGFKGYD